MRSCYVDGRFKAFKTSPEVGKRSVSLIEFGLQRRDASLFIGYGGREHANVGVQVLCADTCRC